MLFSGASLWEMLYRLPIIFIAITVHECAHGFVAYKLGDPTAKQMGRLTLNPIAHMDIIGALSMLLFGFGWAKPVPINPMYFRNRKQGMCLVSLAGPLSNFLMATLGAVIYGLMIRFNLGTTSDFIRGILSTLITLNVCFGVFNLIPFPPLDGAKILGAILPDRFYYTALQYERYAFPVLILLMAFGVLNRVLSIFVSPAISSLEALINLIAHV